MMLNLVPIVVKESTMDWSNSHKILLIIQHSISFAGVLIILSGVVFALYQYISFLFTGGLINQGNEINTIRLNLGRALILGLEFIVAADLISTTTTPDYYAVGILAILVMIRTLLSYSLSKELSALQQKD